MAETVYQLKVTLKEIQPPIWRRFEVRAAISFHELHQTLQVVMGWWDYHLHQFEIGSLWISDKRTLDEVGPLGLLDEATFLNELVRHEGSRFTYEYDFGDSWRHELVLEKILPIEETAVYPRCLAGERACPPEDCGGVVGYEELTTALQDPQHPRHDRYLSWLGRAFDSEAFDLEHIAQQFREGAYWEGKLIRTPLAATQQFTPQARWFWVAIPEHSQVKLLGNVWCTHCQENRTIVNFKGNIRKGDLILRGGCARCGGSVARLIEGG